MASDAEKGLALLKSLAAPHEEGHPDHSWRKCRRCLALEEIDTKEGTRYLRAHLALLASGKESV